MYYQLQMGTSGVPLILDEAQENHLRVEFTRCVEPLPIEDEVGEACENTDAGGDCGIEDRDLDVSIDEDGTVVVESAETGDLSEVEVEPFCASDDDFLLFTKQYQLVVISDVKYLNGNDVRFSEDGLLEMSASKQKQVVSRLSFGSS